MTSRSKTPHAMLAKIDWYSFTIPLRAVLEGTGPDTLGAINHVLGQLPVSSIDPVAADGTWRLDAAKGFYSQRGTHLTSGMFLSWGGVNPHLFMEFPGQACDYLRATGEFTALVTATWERASRIDAAIDIATGCKPEAFVKAGHAKRFENTHGHVVSEQGETCYVGNRKSDRCARVYRYAPPHPRSPLLRVEAEYKGKAARILAEVLAREGELAAVRSAHEVFEWRSREISEGFLISARSAHVQAINPVTGNIVGSMRVFFPLSYDTSETEHWTLPHGLRTWFSQHLKPRR